MISGLQRAQQNEVYCTHVPELMDMVAVGKALGLPSRRVTSDEEAKDAADWAYGHCAGGQGPVLIEAMVSYAAPSFYARGATGQEPTAQVEPVPVEPLPLTKLPEPPCRRADDEARSFSAKELARHRESSSWDISECLRAAVMKNPDGPNAVQAGCAVSRWTEGRDTVLAEKQVHDAGGRNQLELCGACDQRPQLA